MAASADSTIRVLHVDDDPEFLDLVGRLLADRHDDIAVVAEPDPMAATDRIAAEPIDCVVTDYEMPGMDGLELLDAVREQWPSMPVVLFTGEGSEEIASEAISAGVTDYLPKTGDREQYDLLANRIRNAVQRARAEMDYEEVFEKTADGIALHDPETGEVLDVNERFCEMNGYDRGEMVGMDVGEFTADLPEYTDDRARRLVRQAADEGPQVFEWYNRRPDGSVFPVEVHLRHTHIGGRDAVLASVRDISERKETQRRLAAIVENAEQAIYFKNRDGEYELVNAAAVEALDGDREEVIGATDADLLPPDEAERVADTDRRVVENREEVVYEHAIPTRDGERVFRNQKFPLTDATGDVEGIVGISTDVTERRRREQALESRKHRIERLHDVAIDIEAADGRRAVYDLVVGAAEDILAFDMAVLDEARDDELVPVATSSGMPEDGYYETTAVDDPDNVAARAYRTGEPSLDRDIREGEGAPADATFLSGLTVPVGEYGVFQAVAKEAGAFDDEDLELTELLVSHAVQRLRQLDNEAELAARAEELRRQNERLDEFTSIVSHDLRSPVNVAMGELELAREDCESSHLDAIEGTLSRMDDIIDGSLTLARQGERVGDPERVDLADVVTACWGNVSATAATLETGSLPTVRADPDRLKHLLENLFRNAVEHGSTGSRPAADDAVEHAGDGVTVRVGTVDGDASGFYVADDGPGIPADERGTVLEPGYTTSAEGTGLGLAIVRWIAEAHGWDVTVTDSESAGARFEVTGVELA